MSRAKVTVMIPVHNPGPYLAPALASVRNQTLKDFEVLLLDDGCTDGSPEVLAAAVRADPRFRLLSPGRVGLIEAANLLARGSQQRYLARFDADDAMHPRRLEMQAALLDARPDLGVVASLVRHFPPFEVLPGNRRYEGWLNSVVTHEQIAADFYVESPIPNPAAMMRREVFERAGGYRDDGLPEDYAFWLRAFEAGVRFEKVPRILHYWRDHGRRVTRTHPRYSLEAFLRAKAESLLRGPLAGGRPYVVLGAGMKGRRLARILTRAGHPPLALFDDEARYFGRRRQGRPVLPVAAFRPGSALALLATGGARMRAEWPYDIRVA